MTVYNTITTSNNKKMLLFCERIAKRICGKNKQHAIILITGTTGSGKSYTAIEIALEIAMCVVRIKGGKLSDYFDMDRVGIINGDEIIRVMKRMNDIFSINILDDIGVGLNNRKWQSKQNIAMNDVITTFRINSNVLILTVPADGMIDKVIRERAHYVIEMQEPFFNLELTQCKIKKPGNYNSNGKRPFNQYLQDEDGCKIKRNFFCKPPKEYCDEYDLRRKKQTEILSEDRIKQMEEINAAPIEKIQKVTKIDKCRVVREKYDNGEYGDLSKKQVVKNELESEGITYQYFMSNTGN